MNKKIITGFILFTVSIFSFTISLVQYDETIKHTYIVANKKLNEARTTKEDEDLSEAEKLIDDVINNNKKQELKQYLLDLRVDIEKELILNHYLDELKLIDTSLDDNKLKVIKEEIDIIKYDEITEQLNNEIKKIEEKISNKKKAEEEARKKAEEAKQKANFMANAKVLETLKGTLTAYTDTHTACGRSVAGGNIYYNDKQYGKVYIVAGDKSYPCGTIVRFKNMSYFGGKDIYAIVLDRGGAIGKGKRALFDLLFAKETSANNFGVRRNVTCEILRRGY